MLVSLFTREWIEIPFDALLHPLSNSLPLYEGVDWNNENVFPAATPDDVSLFTREWIEICFNLDKSCFCEVSLFTREWIEILNNAASVLPEMSPSLRGSGLK